MAKRIIDYNEVDLKKKKLDDKLRKAAHRRNYYLKNKEKELSKQKEYKQRNREAIAAYQKLYNPTTRECTENSKNITLFRT